MNKTANIWLVVAAAFVAAGLVLSGISIAAANGDFGIFSNGKLKTSTHEITEEFENISVTCGTADVKILPAEDGKVTVECIESENLYYTVETKDGELSVKLTDSRKWYQHISIFYPSLKILIYLPNAEYGKLTVKSDTGDVQLAEGFTFEAINVKLDTGDFKSFANSKGAVSIEADTGDVKLDSVRVGELKIETDTGDVSLSKIECAAGVEISTTTGSVTAKELNLTSLKAKTDTGNVSLTDVSADKDCMIEADTGDVKLTSVIATESFNIKTDTGNVIFDRADAPDIRVKTDTGDVKGTLLSEKTFITRTDTGDVKVPDTRVDSYCEVETDTGDIRLSVAE